MIETTYPTSTKSQRDAAEKFEKNLKEMTEDSRKVEARAGFVKGEAVIMAYIDGYDLQLPDKFGGFPVVIHYPGVYDLQAMSKRRAAAERENRDED